MKTRCSLRRSLRGATLVEAMIALVVVGFGLVTLAGFGLGLSRHAEVARERSEATRLAQEKLEGLRGFERIESGAGVAAYADLVAGSDVPVLASPTSYTRSWRVTTGAGDLHRLVAVTVGWTDRAGTAESVTLHSVVSRTDPADIGSIALPPPAASLLRRTRERSLDIPFEAVPLGGANHGRSALPWNGGATLVFDDASGAVIARCAGPVDDATELSSCVALQGFLLEGYIGGDLPAALALGFDRLQYTLAGAAPECMVWPAADQNSGAAIGTATLRYRCLVQPGDHDADPTTPSVWSGRMRFAGLAAGSVACRYTSAADTTVNAEHPETYTLLATSLSQQNYVIAGTGTCPGDSVPHQGA